MQVVSCTFGNGWQFDHPLCCIVCSVGQRYTECWIGWSISQLCLAGKCSGLNLTMQTVEVLKTGHF